MISFELYIYGPPSTILPYKSQLLNLLCGVTFMRAAWHSVHKIRVN